MDPSAAHPSTHLSARPVAVNGFHRHAPVHANGVALPVTGHATAGFRSVVAAASSGIVVVSRKGELLFANSSARRLLGGLSGAAAVELLGFPFVAGAGFEIALADGEAAEVLAFESMWDGVPVWIATLLDISAHKRVRAELEGATARMAGHARQLERLANHDPLTELLNRRGLEAELAREAQRRRRTGAPLAAILVDIDDFKRINDALGQADGDGVLREVARRLHASLRPLDHLARVGGDEFLVLLPETRLAQAFQVAERLRLSVCGERLRGLPGEPCVSVSLGVVAVTAGSTTLDEVLHQSQLALQHSKRNGKNRGSDRNGARSDSHPDALALLARLQSPATFRALRRPVVRLHDEGIVAWELLARGPAGNFEDPRDYHRLASEHGLLASVDLHGLQACLVRAHTLPSNTRCHVGILPATLLATPVAQVLETIRRYAPTTRLCIGLEEQHLLGEHGVLRDHVRALKQAGHQVAIVGVGFGRGSLEALILLEPDQVRIAPDFLRDWDHHSGRERSLRRVIAIVKSLGSELVADGIETREDLGRLRRLGVPCGQGLLWGSAD